MRAFSMLLALALCVSLSAQNFGNAPDTLLIHTFEGILDPADTMLTQPGGDDIHWVNYDQDNKIGKCVLAPGITPKGWYWEVDLGSNDPNTADNYAFTSCSYLNSPAFRNRNWLITSPVFVPDDTYWLCWRSLSYYGPDLMDGYQVLASNTTNLPTAFSDTLFSVAETAQTFQIGSLNLADYIFSKGYIHANGYTDSTYFFVDFEGGEPFYHGKLEPHSVSLSDYAGQTIYLAFLHDSKNDFQLQVDDILVSKFIVPTNSPANLLYFNVLPNPVRDFAYLNWQCKTPQAGRCTVADQNGKLVFEQAFGSRDAGQLYIETALFAPGIYFCTLETAEGRATRLLVKI